MEKNSPTRGVVVSSSSKLSLQAFQLTRLLGSSNKKMNDFGIILQHQRENYNNNNLSRRLSLSTIHYGLISKNYACPLSSYALYL